MHRLLPKLRQPQPDRELPQRDGSPPHVHERDAAYFDALQKVAARAPDLILTDLVMPEMDGLELIRMVRDRHPGIPVVLMTAYGDETVALQALDAGADLITPRQ